MQVGPQEIIQEIDWREFFNNPFNEMRKYYPANNGIILRNIIVKFRIFMQPPTENTMKYLTISADNINKVSIGDKLDEHYFIDAIYYQSDKLIIYKSSEKKKIIYTLLDADSCTLDRFGRIDTLMDTLSVKTKGTRRNEADTIYINCLISALDGNDESFNRQIDKFDKFVNNSETIENIISQTQGYIIWMSGSECKYHIHENPSAYEAAIIEFNKFRNLSNSTLPSLYKPVFERHLSAALATSFLQSDNNKDHFKEAEDFLTKIISTKTKMQYVVSLFCSSAILISLLYLASCFEQQLSIPKILNNALPIMQAGILGAFISTFERSKSLNVTAKESPELIIFYGLFRVLLGCIFGFISYLLVNSGFAFAIFKDSNSAIILLGIVAGFSERLIPDLIYNISEQSKNLAKT